jgi:hypothetical protein
MPNPLIEVMRLGVSVLEDTQGEIAALREELARDHARHDMSQGYPTGSLQRQGEAMKRLDELLAFQMDLELRTGRTFLDMIRQAKSTIEAWEKMNARPRGAAAMMVGLMLDPPRIWTDEK